MSSVSDEVLASSQGIDVSVVVRNCVISLPIFVPINICLFVYMLMNRSNKWVSSRGVWTYIWATGALQLSQLNQIMASLSPFLPAVIATVHIVFLCIAVMVWIEFSFKLLFYHIFTEAAIRFDQTRMHTPSELSRRVSSLEEKGSRYERFIRKLLWKNRRFFNLRFDRPFSPSRILLFFLGIFVGVMTAVDAVTRHPLIWKARGNSALSGQAWSESSYICLGFIGLASCLVLSIANYLRKIKEKLYMKHDLMMEVLALSPAFLVWIFVPSSTFLRSYQDLIFSIGVEMVILVVLGPIPFRIMKDANLERTNGNPIPTLKISIREASEEMKEVEPPQKKSARTPVDIPLRQAMKYPLIRASFCQFLELEFAVENMALWELLNDAFKELSIGCPGAYSFQNYEGCESGKNKREPDPNVEDFYS
eukprot:TRINITY_DN4805_c0_g2_i1.p1 TRINITY_DN4805_c0_g2~~TRINITY_DN4805_c0_g2_i1.p1  ORF type:complete len:421 (+),score=70.11 TRINITY_DN4805_c0_g2_i1:217-1479(+)